MLLIGLKISSNQAFAHSSKDFSQIAVSIGGKALMLDYANTPELREHGLQHKRVLCDDCGMLFDYEQNQVAALWTKDTFLPIDIAFVEDNGEIIRIVQMMPFDEDKQSSEKPVRYAIEMRRGWFSQHKVKVGAKVVISLPEE